MNRCRRCTRLALAAALAVSALSPAPAGAADLTWTALGGYQQGAGLRIQGTLARLTPVIPLAVQFGFGYAVVDPGKPELTRRVFINDNTNGTPEESGHVWDLRADLVWLMSLGMLEDVGIFVGPRRSMFTGRFHFVGGNEDFLVESNAWGVGAGIRAELRLGRRWSLAGAAGVDWYPKTTIYSHDTSYSSSGYVVNGHHEYGFADADRAVNQPKLVPSLLLGVAWRP